MRCFAILGVISTKCLAKSRIKSITKYSIVSFSMQLRLLFTQPLTVEGKDEESNYQSRIRYTDRSCITRLNYTVGELLHRIVVFPRQMPHHVALVLLINLITTLKSSQSLQFSLLVVHVLEKNPINVFLPLPHILYIII